MSLERNSQLAAELRAAFDASFSSEVAADRVEQVDVLAIRVASHDYAVALRDIAALHADRRIVPAPSAAPGFLGLVGLRGQILPAYDLGRLLGHTAAASAPRWLIVAPGRTPLALAFETFEAHWRLPRSALTAKGEASSDTPTSGSVRTPQGPRALIDLAALVEAITGGAPQQQHSSLEEGR